MHTVLEEQKKNMNWENTHTWGIYMYVEKRRMNSIGLELHMLTAMNRYICMYVLLHTYKYQKDIYIQGTCIVESVGLWIMNTSNTRAQGMFESVGQT